MWCLQGLNLFLWVVYVTRFESKPIRICTAMNIRRCWRIISVSKKALDDIRFVIYRNYVTIARDGVGHTIVMTWLNARLIGIESVLLSTSDLYVPTHLDHMLPHTFAHKCENDMLMYSLTRVDNASINMRSIIVITQVCWSRALHQLWFSSTTHTNPGSLASNYLHIHYGHGIIDRILLGIDGTYVLTPLRCHYA